MADIEQGPLEPGPLEPGPLEPGPLEPGGIEPGESGLDDRSQPFQRRTLRAIAALGEEDGVSRRSAVRLIRNAINLEASRLGITNLMLAIGLLSLWTVGCCGLAIVNPFPRSISPWAPVLFALGSLVLAGHVFRWPARARIERSIAPTLVAAGFCGSCGYPLAGLSPEADGCVVCPECSAAWKALRLGALPGPAHQAAGDCAEPPGSPTPAQARADWLARAIRFTPPRHRLIAPDDRGRLVHVPDRRLLWLSPQRRAELGPQRLREARSALSRIGLPARLLVAGVLILLGIAFAMSSAGQLSEEWMRRAAAWEMAFMLVPGAMLIAIAAAVLYSHAFFDRREAARSLVRQGLCGSCAGSLAGLPRDGDGCVTCPTCTAAWRPDPAWSRPGEGSSG